MSKDKNFFDNHVLFFGLGFGSKDKDQTAAKTVKKNVKHHLAK